MQEGNGPRRKALTVIGAIFGLVAIAWLIYWLLVLNQRESTDDAYVAGNQVAVSAQVSGTVIALLIDDTQRVEAGQPLLRLDPTDAEVALARAGATLQQAVRQIRQQAATASQFDAQIESRRLDLLQAEEQLQRRRPLLAEEAVSAEELRQSEHAVELARAALRGAERQSRAAHSLIEGVAIEQHPAVLEARSAYEQAWLAARRNVILAPIAGYVARRSVQLGQRVQPGQMLLFIVPLDSVWVDANFKESQLRELRIGQHATMSADAYGGKVRYRGTVAGVAAGTGSAFALLPAQNASGNWVKIVQRVPVRIELDAQQLVANPLRLGLSMTVNVDIRDQSGVMLAAATGARVVAATDMYGRDAADAAAAATALIDGRAQPAP